MDVEVSNVLLLDSSGVWEYRDDAELQDEVPPPRI